MKKGRIYMVSACLAVSNLLFSCRLEKKGEILIQWDNSLLLPPCREMPVNIGLAGAFAGIVGGDLILLGGANFPVAPPWEGGKKVWYATFYTIGIDENAPMAWKVREHFIDRRLAYGVSIQLPDGMLCLGGCDKDRCYAEVFSIVKGTDGALVLGETRYPALPVALANAAGTLAGTKIYLAGGQETVTDEASTQHFFCLDLERLERGWMRLPAWPGPSRAYAVCESQGGKVYLFSGRSFAPEQPTTMLDDGYVYDPETGVWEKLPGRYPVMAGTSVPLASDKILLLGGVAELLPTAPDHPGFSNEILVFDVNDGSLTTAGIAPYPIPVTCHTVSAGNRFYVASGEIKPGVRTPRLLRGTIE